MSQSSINPTVILNELRSSEVKLLFEHLKMFTENLEEKIDPDPIEIQIVDAAYQLIEKVQLFESVMKQYSSAKSEDLLGNQLDRLYNSGKVASGTSILFKH
ncbi:hypothetical protein KAR91_41285 [Candidatus Pacearchaeota archaeon]|nr:hypothetical protein [Candidatus Pacearchaeota archaeon]